jgi:hypothetical protein
MSELFMNVVSGSLDTATEHVVLELTLQTCVQELISDLDCDTNCPESSSLWFS